MAMDCLAPMRGFLGHSVRCRRCSNCLKLRSYEWSDRILWEAEVSKRVWWITLTYASPKGERGGSLPPSSSRQAVSLSDPSHAVGYDDVQKWLKRLRMAATRKGYGPIRFCCALERGGNGSMRLHWHVLLFSNDYLPRRLFERKWAGGYVHARLAKGARGGKAADVRIAQLSTYVSKYATKAGRLRSSTGFGRCAFLGWERDALRDAGDNPIVVAALDTFPGTVVTVRKKGLRMPRTVWKQRRRTQRDEMAPPFSLGSPFRPIGGYTTASGGLHPGLAAALADFYARNERGELDRWGYPIDLVLEPEMPSSME